MLAQNLTVTDALLRCLKDAIVIMRDGGWTVTVTIQVV